MKRPLFVFAGQSNMMGAAVYEASEQIYFKNSFEYLHKPKRFGEDLGGFKDYGFPSGEFSYKDLSVAYKDASFESKSDLADYRENTYFCPSMCNLEDDETKSVHPFNYFSEATNRRAVTLAPFVVKNLEEAGYPCAYAHITRGGTPIKFFIEGEGSEYFAQKISDFFSDSEMKFSGDDTSERVLVWLQGESDAKYDYAQYVESLKVLWQQAKALSFTKFFIVRVDYFGNSNITEIMRAQEDFCAATENAYIITRVASYFEWDGANKLPLTPVDTPFIACRDSYYGFKNNHINEKGFKEIAKYATPNIIRILFEGKEPVLEAERVCALIPQKEK